MNYPDYSFDHHYHSVKGLRLHYLDEGPKNGDEDAEPVVMVHGNPSWSFYYRKLVLALRDNYRCIVPDHIGMGLSDKPGDETYNFTLDQRVDDLESLLDHLDITVNITLVVHDWGGMIGMAYATHHPERIKRLVILNTSAFHLPKDKSVPWQLKLSRIPVVGAILNQGFNIFARGAVKQCVTRNPMSPEVAAAYLAPYDNWSHRRAIKKFVFDIPLQAGDTSYETLDQVDKTVSQFLNIPMLICWGLKDFVFDQHFLKEWEKRFPNAECHRFEDVGHYILEDAPEDVIPLVQQFLHAHPLNQKDSVMHSSNIASHLATIAKLQPDALAVAEQKSGQQYTYRQLDDASDLIAKGLQAAGISKGVRIVLMVTPGLDFFALVFALFKVGAVMVAIDPGIDTKQLGKCLTEVEPEAFIGIKKAHIARRVLGWARKTIKTNIIVDPGFMPKAFYGRNIKSLGQLKQSGADYTGPASIDTQADDTAAILFTSGSTGSPKGVVYSHENFNAQVATLKNLYDIQPGEIDLSAFPLFALFGPAMGMASIVPDMDFTRPGNVDPEKIFSAIEKYKVTNMFGSPALLNRVGRYGEQHNKKLPNMNRVLSAGAPVPAKAMQRIADMLNNGAQVFTPYGATESLPVSSIGSDEVLGSTCQETEKGKGVCVGLPVENIDLKIIGITDDVISGWHDDLILDANVIGEIAVKGPQVTKAYYARQRATEMAKISDADGSFYHRMGDTGYLDKQGRLWFCGRLTHRVITDKEALFTTPCEGIFNTHAKVFRTALVGINNNEQIIPVICVELEQEFKDTKKEIITTELLEIGAEFEQTNNIQHVLFHPAFPVDIRHNAKIGREKLALWAEKEIIGRGFS